jgi:hypothetical protein
MARDVEHFFMSLKAICNSSLEIVSPFIHCIVDSLGGSFLNSLCMPAKIFSHSVSCLFSLVMISFAVWKFSSLMQS